MAVDAGAPGALGAAPDLSDEVLMHRLAAGQQEALAPLYARYAPLIYNLAAQSLDRPAAEEVVQEVFLAVWRHAGSFDPERRSAGGGETDRRSRWGSFRPWVLQIAHLRVLNELRRRSRRPQIESDPDDARLASLPADEDDPAEAVWREYRRLAVRSAVDALPPAQRVALGLAFFEELTHEQVASVLQLPLGTAKTRIRTALLRLRASLAPLLAALVLLLALVPGGLWLQSTGAALQRHQRALALVTSSETQALRLGPAPGVPDEAHGTYRSQPGKTVAVLSLSHLPPLAAGQAYQGWARIDGVWVSLGSGAPGADRRARIIAEGAELARPADAVQVTREPASGSSAPAGPAVILWSAGS